MRNRKNARKGYDAVLHFLTTAKLTEGEAAEIDTNRAAKAGTRGTRRNLAALVSVFRAKPAKFKRCPSCLVDLLRDWTVQNAMLCRAPLRPHTDSAQTAVSVHSAEENVK